jgi:hypothetical protein
VRVYYTVAEATVVDRRKRLSYAAELALGFVGRRKRLPHFVIEKQGRQRLSVVLM